MSCKILAMMAAMCKLQYLFIIGVYLQLRFSYVLSYKLPYNGVEIVTYGEPCHLSRYLPVTIEEPVKPVTEENVLRTPCVYQPLKLNYQVIDKSPIPYQLQAKYPISIEVPPKVPTKFLEVVKLDPHQRKSYTYNTQIPPPPPVPISTNYNFDLHVPSSPSSTTTDQVSQPVKLLTGLTAKIESSNSCL
ncbi:uncharacterized protein [Anoplolepis gracilipes]|uniref:uncharacterized protein n=1 Tax=Anoplolepis gracilipes TaxID=354296 RepID=UPI003B9E6704